MQPWNIWEFDKSTMNSLKYRYAVIFDEIKELPKTLEWVLKWVLVTCFWTNRLLDIIKLKFLPQTLMKTSKDVQEEPQSQNI